MENGERFDASTLDQIWPARQRLEPPFWWTDRK
jgi:hypothetical protein